VAYAKTTSIPCPITVQKAVIKTLQDAGVVVAIDFPSLHTNDLLLSIWYAESAAFDPSQDRARIEMIQQWPLPLTYLELHGLFRLNTSRAVCVTVMQQAFPLLSEYDIIIVPSMAEEPMALTCPQAIPVSRYQLV
jgi:hypothetical protein